MIKSYPSLLNIYDALAMKWRQALSPFLLDNFKSLKLGVIDCIPALTHGGSRDPQTSG
jgi:hypothetical protein